MSEPRRGRKLSSPPMRRRLSSPYLRRGRSKTRAINRSAVSHPDGDGFEDWREEVMFYNLVGLSLDLNNRGERG